ncbi:MAG: FtsX-like permease family protein, partial [Verrucomicrobiae bacterium]|nr:FtsX-like permease family protein [Verrucomicrobiae bacterium]
MPQAVQEQVRLPFAIAMGVVLQGIRIRLGRSLVTIAGVVLGLAFLMSILTGQMIKTGVRAEAELRTDVRRMVNTMSAEIGPLKDRRIHLVQEGELEVREHRLLEALRREGVHFVGAGEGVTAVLAVGTAEPPTPESTRLVFTTRASARKGVRSLQYQPSAEELAMQQEREREARPRTVWIVAVSLLVTVISISNAMLMSVTERFREIGTMKCLGALSAFIRQVFIIESGIIGLVGGLVGSMAGALVAIVVYGLSFG